MKRYGFILVAVISLLVTGTEANAASRPDLVIKGFQQYVASAKSALVAAKVNYDSKVSSINIDYAKALEIAKSTYDREVLSAKNLYEPQINSSLQSIKEAKAKLLTVNQVRVLKQGNERSKWGYLNCPSNRLDCIYVDKGELFVVGEITTLKSIVGENVDYLAEVLSMVDTGLIELINSVEFKKAASIIREEPLKIKSNTALWDSANSAASAKQIKANESARLAASAPLMLLMDNFETSKLSLESQIIAGNWAIRAAKRASKNPSTFEKAFVTAFKFEYNVKGLDRLANMSFADLNSLRLLLSQYATIELADKAASIDASYNYLAAERINKAVDDVFTSDEEFQTSAKLVAAQFKKLTKVTLKF